MGLDTYYTGQSKQLADQLISLNTTDGVTTYTLSDFDAFVGKEVVNASIMGIRIGCSFIVLLLYVVLTPDRTSPYFICNTASLTFCLVSSALYLKFLTSAFRSVSYFFTGSLATVTMSDVENTMVCDLINALLILSIMSSLYFQTIAAWPLKLGERSRSIVKVVFACLVLPCAVLFMLSFGLSMGLAMHPTNQRMAAAFSKVSVAVQPVFAATVLVISAIFAGKLVYCLIRRHRLGLQQIEKKYVVLIVFSQCMLIPGILVLINNLIPKENGMVATNFSYLSSMVVCISLPISTIWARYASDSSKPPSFFFARSASRSSGSTQRTAATNSYYDEKCHNAKVVTKHVISGDEESSLGAVDSSPVTPVDDIPCPSLNSYNNSDDDDRVYDYNRLHISIDNGRRV